MKNIVFVILFSIIVTNLFGQKSNEVVKVCGEYTYYTPENITMEQAKRTALERAKADAIGKKFGSNIFKDVVRIEEEKDGKYNDNIFIFGGSEEKGEWLETIGEPIYEPDFKNGTLVMKVSVCGMAQKIISAGVDFSAKILNNADSKYETENFNHGEDIYLSFRSPVDGYLAVYLIDNSQTAFCLLPYENDPTGKVAIKSGKDYIFFSKKYAGSNEKNIVTEYMLTCEKALEYNILYIIFSPNEFTKANDNKTKTDNQFTLPRELSFADFQKWLSKNKQIDKDLKYVTKNLTIKK